MEWNYEFDIAALIITTVIYWILLQQKNFPTTTNRIFRVLLTFIWLSTFFDLVGIFTIEKAEYIPLGLNYIVQIIYLTTFNSCSIFYYIYVLSMTKEHRIITTARKLLVIFPACVI